MFDLTEEIVSQIIFSMENQNRAFLVRLRDGLVIPAERKGEESGALPGDRYEEPPPWQSSDGYQMMERFVVTVRNPLVREQLRTILSSGRGVFRQFKDTLQEWPEVQRRWFSFKRQEMRSRILAWYNALRDREGLPRIPVELASEETDELVLSDFSIRPVAETPVELLRRVDREAFFEAYGDVEDAVVEHLYTRRRAAAPPFGAAGSILFGAYAADEKLAGLLWATAEGLPDGTRLEQIEQIYVFPEYRGLGIAETLTNYYLTDADHRGVTAVLLEGPYLSDPVGRILEQAGARRLYVGSLFELGAGTDGIAGGREEEYPPDSYL
jgi:ribosomal protein S18 acetylase RimI-like enzyme